ncbi:MAG: site-specific integrase [Gammaproteobacteria bacterium]
MRKHNALNERIKREYFIFLKEAKRQSEQSVDMVAKALARFEAYTRHKDFKFFHTKQAIGFKNHLAEQVNPRTGKKLSKATLNSTLAQLKRFFQWLAGYPGYRSKFSYSDAEYFNLSEKEVRIASARRDQKVPTLEQIHHVIAQMPTRADIDRRNRALVAFILLTGARDSAVASLKLKHVDLVAGCVRQDAREVKTKFSKTFTTTFFPVGGEARAIVEDWLRYLRGDKLWGNDDPLFPATDVKRGGSGHFEVVGLARKRWSNASPIREVFRVAFERAGLPYYNPHCFRKTLVQLGQQLCKDAEHFKAWSQNLGHEDVLTTFVSYGQVSSSRQAEIIQKLADPHDGEQSNIDAIAQAVARLIKAEGWS